MARICTVPSFPNEEIPLFELRGDYILAAEYSPIQLEVRERGCLYRNTSYQWVGYIAHHDGRRQEKSSIHQGHQFYTHFKVKNFDRSMRGIGLIFNAPGQINVSISGVVDKVTATKSPEQEYACCTREYVFGVLNLIAHYYSLDTPLPPGPSEMEELD